MVSNNYSKAQKEAIRHKKGPLMVLAGPGSGKTFVITHRIKYIIEELKVSANNILVVTFSRAAAIEMKERFEKLSASRGVNFGTFHSIFFGILKKAYGYTSEQIISENEKQRVIKEIVEKFKDFKNDINTIVTNIIEEISKLKQERIDIRFFYSKTCSVDIFKQIYKLYEERLAKLRKIDFDDMLLMTYELLSQREDIRQACSNNYKYILVDEFQDINNIQYLIVKLLLDENKNITIVGDDDQSIYSFRGARPDIMLNFDKDYKDCKKVILDINFRSSKQIVEAATKLIRHNKIRFDKKIMAQ